MKSLIRFFASRGSLANVFTFLVLVFGVGSLSVLQRDNFPRVDFDQLSIVTRYLGASPEDVELNVTNLIEDSLREVDGIKSSYSYSMENISFVHVTLDPDNQEKTRTKNEIRDAIARISDFPAELDERPVVKSATTANLFPIIEVGITGEVPYDALRAIAKETERDLLKLPGVASVARYGFLDREIKIEVLPEAIEKWQIPNATIAEAIRKRNIRSTGGSFDSFTSDKNIVTLAQFEDPEEVEDVIVHSFEGGNFIRVRDLAVVKSDFEPAKVLTRMNGRPAISFLVYKKESADLIRTASDIRDYIFKTKEYLPENVDIEYSNDSSRLVRNRLNVVLTNGAMGLALVLVVLALFLNLRSAFWVAMGIPITLLGVLFFLPVFGAYLDSIALGAMILVIGIVVDDGIVVAEAVWKKREDGLSPLDASVAGLNAVMWPVLTTILTTMLAFIPMFFMPGMLGDFIFVIPLVVVLALAVSLAEIVVALPAHLRGRGAITSAAETREGVFMSAREVYGRFLELVLPFRYLVISLFVGMLVGAFWYAGKHMSFVLFPSQSADAFKVLVELPSGASLQATSDKVIEIERLIKQLPESELDSFVTRIGNHGELGQGENENWAYLGIYLTPFATRSRNADEIVDQIRLQVEGIGDIEKIVFQIESGGPPVGNPITLHISGGDDERRNDLAALVIDKLQAIEGVKDIDRNDKIGKEQVKIDLDFIRLADAGLTVADIAQNVQLAYDGEIITTVRYGGEDVGFRVIMAEEARESIDSLSMLLIPTPREGFIRLGEVAEFRSQPGYSSVFHYENERTITITADVVKSAITPFDAIQKAIGDIDQLRDWQGLRIVVAGEVEETTESMTSLFVAFTAAAIAIYLLLYLLFQSLLQPVFVLFSVPFGLVGVIAAFELHQEPLGFLALLGVVGLSGIVVNDSLILVQQINYFRREQPADPLAAMVAEGAKARFRPIFLTTVTTVSGLLPLAYGLGGSDPFSAPMALALGYGLLFATVVTLVLLPCVLMLEADIKSTIGFFRRRNV